MVTFPSLSLLARQFEVLGEPGAVLETTVKILAKWKLVPAQLNLAAVLGPSEPVRLLEAGTAKIFSARGVVNNLLDDWFFLPLPGRKDIGFAGRTWVMVTAEPTADGIVLVTIAQETPQVDHAVDVHAALNSAIDDVVAVFQSLDRLHSVRPQLDARDLPATNPANVRRFAALKKQAKRLR